MATVIAGDLVYAAHLRTLLDLDVAGVKAVIRDTKIAEAKAIMPSGSADGVGKKAIAAISAGMVLSAPAQQIQLPE